MKSGEPLVASANVVAALGFEVTEKRAHAISREILDTEPGDLSTALTGNVCEEELEGVAVAPDRRRAQSLLCLQMPLEECVDDRAERGHGAPPVESGATKRAKRSPATCNRSAVMVR